MNETGKPISKLLRSDKTVFTFKDVCLIWGSDNKKSVVSKINYYVKIGELYRIRRGIYAKDKNYNKQELSTRILTPSYISFETVLIEAGINFQFYSQIFLASYQTRELVIGEQIYAYKKMKDSILTNNAGIEFKDQTSVATPERAFLDTIYINKEYHFDNLNSLNWDKVFEILPIYDKKRMEKRVKLLSEYQKNNA